jgi:hypothetical protein
MRASNRLADAMGADESATIWDKLIAYNGRQLWTAASTTREPLSSAVLASAPIGRWGPIGADDAVMISLVHPSVPPQS